MNISHVEHPCSYSSFLKQLDRLLRSSGIQRNRLPVSAEYNSEKNDRISSDPKIKQQVGRVILYMEEHISEELTLDELAGEVNLSKYQLIRRFRCEKGTTPWRFLKEKRVEKVKNMLEEGMSPGQAAVESGFYDQSHMNKVFRENTGQTPKEYQEENFRNRN